MGAVPPTRASLLVRLKAPRDERAWIEFVEIYEPLIHRLARPKGCRRPTRMTWHRTSSARSPTRSSGGTRPRQGLVPCVALADRPQLDRQLLRVVTIIDNVPIKIIDAQRQRGSLLKDRSVPLIRRGTERSCSLGQQRRCQPLGVRPSWPVCSSDSSSSPSRSFFDRADVRGRPGSCRGCNAPRRPWGSA